MSLVRKILGPKSKYDKSLPYTYMACKPVIEGDDELYSYYFSDTICGLVEYLEDNGILPVDVKIFGLYKNQEIELDKNIFILSENEWLKPPQLCAVLEDHYKSTGDEIYKGHIEKHECSFDDRDKSGTGAH
jgi:hypothetical protein